MAVLHNEALPFYGQHGLEVGAVLTDNGTEFCTTPEHPYELYSQSRRLKPPPLGG